MEGLAVKEDEEEGEQEGGMKVRERRGVLTEMEAEWMRREWNRRNKGIRGNVD